MKKSILITWAILALFTLMEGCGKDSSPSEPKNDVIQNNLTFTRQDGSQLIMVTDYVICCGIWDPGYDDRYSLFIAFFDSVQVNSRWMLNIVPEEITFDSPFVFPGTSNLGTYMFVLDASSDNELSSYESESSGTITINVLDCGPPLQIDLTIDATLASEFWDAPPVTVSGTFSATIHSNSECP